MFREIVDQSDSAVVVSDLESRTIVYANEAVRIILDIPAEKVLIGESTNVLYPKGKARLSQEVIDHLSEEDFWETQVETHKNKYLRLRAKKMLWEERPAYVIYIIDDTLLMQEQKQMESIYINRISRSLNISDKTEVAFVFDLTENRILESSSNNYEMFARLSQIEVDKYLENICESSDDPGKLSEQLNVTAMMEAFEKGSRRESVQYYNRIKRRDFECSYDLLKNPYTGHIESFVSFQDITEAVKLEKVMQSLMKMNYVAIYTVDMKTLIPTVYATTEGGRIRKLREEGMNYEQYIDHYLHELGQGYHEERTKSENNIDRVKQELSENSYYITQFGFYNKEERGRLCQYTAIYRYLDEHKEVLLVVLTDVTEEYEQERREKLKLEIALKEAEAANAAKTDFLSRMSHDIRTPMNAIMGLTQLAEGEEMTPKAREYISKITTSSEFLLRLVNDILDISKIENGELELHPEPFTPQEFYREIQTIMQPLISQKKVHFHLSMSERKETLMVDRLRFNQIFFNLLSNAVKFTPEGGDIYLFSEVIPAKDDRRGFRFHVKDTGIGMSDDFQNRVFDPFEQEANDIVKNTQGTGLGTTIVKRIVEAMDGEIAVRSRQGVGTEFIVDLYLAPGNGEDAPSIGHNITQITNYLDGKRVLLVEDNELNVMVAKAQLKKVGMDVTVATNGLEAVGHFGEDKKQPFDAVLMDRRMPVMDGLEATRRIRSFNKKIPIIAMTADAFDDDARVSLEAGMNAHLTKPVVPDKLYRTLASCMILQ